MKTLHFFLFLLQTSMRSSISKRGAFLIEISLMVLNNLIFFSMWWIFFLQFKTVDGWSFKDMAILIAVASGSYGLMSIFFGGIKKLSQLILNGDLDIFMTKPKSLLLHVGGSKSYAKGWGHLLSALIVLVGAIFQDPSLIVFLPLIFLSMISGCLVFASLNVIAHSLPFWLGSIETVSKKYCDSLYVFANYPTNIYRGFLQLVMFTLIPAGVISYLPVELVRNFSWDQLAILIVSALFFCTFAFLTFCFGLKRYESGNQFGSPL